MKPHIAIAMAVAEGIEHATFRSIMQLDLPRPFEIFDVHGHPVEMARNEIVGRIFSFNDEMRAVGKLDEVVTHVLWIDDDMTFPPDAFKRLLAHDVAVVGGLCHNRRHPFMPILLHRLESPDNGGRKPYLYEYDYPENTLLPVDATGAAFILVKMEVYEAIEAKFPVPGEGPYSHRGQGEDVAFCERAKECGYQTYVDTGLEIGHVGKVIVDSNFARKNRVTEFNPYLRTTKALPPPGKPVASIIIPTYNQKPAWLHEAVESALGQTVPVEVIVVDDGSTPAVKLRDLQLGDTPNESDERLRLIRHETNRGCFHALNTGIAAMTTEWFCWLSSDDRLYPKKLQRQLRQMLSSNVLASYHSYTLQSEINGSMLIPVVTWKNMEEQQKTLANVCAINGLTAVIHKSVLDDVGVFDTSYTIVADWELWNRIGRKYFWLPLQDALANRRDFDNYSVRYANDPEKRKIWASEDAKVRSIYQLLAFDKKE